MHEDLDNQYILKLVEVFRSRRSPSSIRTELAFHVLEYCNGNSLEAELSLCPENRFSVKETQHIMKQLLRALSYCHFRGICHRNINLKQVLLSMKSSGLSATTSRILKYVIKLKGFKKATNFKTQLTLNSVVGDVAFRAPEVIIYE